MEIPCCGCKILLNIWTIENRTSKYINVLKKYLLIMLLNIMLFIASFLSINNNNYYDLEISMPEIISIEDTVVIDVKFHNNSNRKVLIRRGHIYYDFSRVVKMLSLKMIVFNDDIYFLPYSNKINYPYSAKPIKVKRNSTHSFQIKTKFDQMIKAGDNNDLAWKKTIKPLVNGDYFIQIDMLLSNTRIRSNILKIKIINSENGNVSN